MREAAALESLAQLKTGDHLVHGEHGIGVYRGLVQLAVGPARREDAKNEFLRIEYDGGDRLFVPVHRLSLVQRYVGAEGVPPRMDKLGGITWEKTKRNAKKSLRDMARELLGIHAARELAEGFAFSPRDRALEEFEGAFPYEETPDQQAAIEDVLGDMQNGKPMDRLVCGDVGYGKTEVAMRAAFKAIDETGKPGRRPCAHDDPAVPINIMKIFPQADSQPFPIKSGRRSPACSLGQRAPAGRRLNGSHRDGVG